MWTKLFYEIPNSDENTAKDGTVTISVSLRYMDLKTFSSDFFGATLSLHVNMDRVETTWLETLTALSWPLELNFEGRLEEYPWRILRDTIEDCFRKLTFSDLKLRYGQQEKPLKRELSKKRMHH